MARSRLKVILAEMDMTYAELADRTGLAYETVCRIANGRTPHVDSAYRIAKALGLHITRVFPGAYDYSRLQRKLV